MPQTKHAFILGIAILCVPLFILGYLSLAKPSLNDAPIIKSDFQTANSAQIYTAYVENEDTKTNSRDSFIARLREYRGSQTSQNQIVQTDTSQITDENVAFGEPVPQDGNLMLGDGKIRTQPERGFIFSCEGAQKGDTVTAPWIEENFWNPADKVSVGGSVFWENSFVSTLPEGARLITTNGLPAHSTGVFPIPPFSDAYLYRGEDASIVSQTHTYQFPKDPVALSAPQCVPQGKIGVAINGVPFYRGLNGTGNDSGAHEVLDRCGGRPSITGEYHYYGESECLFDAYYEGAPSTLLGYALDGFGIFANEENEKALTNANLDVCHGHTHEIPWDGHMVSMFHYHMTDEFPYTVGCFVGEPITVVP